MLTMLDKPKKGAANPRSLDQPYLPGDPIPAADAVERSTETTWEMWNDALAGQEARLTDTAPVSQTSAPDALPARAQGYDATVPQPLSARRSERPAPGPDRPAGARISLEDALAEARRNNRSCPMPDAWKRVYELLPGKQNTRAGWRPSPPVIGRAWLETSSLTKRLTFREHLEWAAAHGGLQAVFSFIAQLGEDEWHHMGD